MTGQTPRPDENRDGHRGHQRNLDAESVALMDNVDTPDDLSAKDLGAVQEVGSESGRQAPVKGGSVSTGSAGESGPADIRPDDVPHSTYRPLNGGDEITEDSDRSRLTDAQETQITAAAESLNSYVPDQSENQALRAVEVAVVITPLNQIDGLAGMYSLLDLDCTVVSSSSGAFAARQFVSIHSDWDVAELLDGSDSEPAEAAELAAQLFRPSRADAVLMTADLTTDVGIESDLSGAVTARHFTNGRPGEEASAGLLLASMDQVVEGIFLGVIDADDVPGAVKSSEIQAPRVMRWFGRGLHRPPQ